MLNYSAAVFWKITSIRYETICNKTISINLKVIRIMQFGMLFLLYFSLVQKKPSALALAMQMA